MNVPSTTPGDCKACVGGQRSTTAGLRRIFCLGICLPFLGVCLLAEKKVLDSQSLDTWLLLCVTLSGVQRLFKLDSGMHTEEQNTPCSEKCVNWMSSRKAWGSHTPEWTLEAWSAGCSLGSAGWVSVGSGGNTDTQLRGKCLHTAQLHLTNWNASAKSHWRCPRVSQMYLWDCQKLHRIYSGLVTFWSRSCSCLGYLKWHRSFMCGQLNQAVCVNLELDCDWKAKIKISKCSWRNQKTGFASSRASVQHLQLDIDYPLKPTLT